MARKAAPKAVFREQFSALTKMKMLALDDQMKITRTRADRAIAGKYLDLCRRLDIKAQATTMTRTGVKK